MATVIRYGAFGDMVMLLPMLRWLAERHETPIDVVSSGSWVRPLLYGQPYVGEVCLVNSRSAPYWLSKSQRLMVRWLEERRDGSLYVCQTDRKALGFSQRAAWPSERVYWAANAPSLPNEHWVERWLRIAHESRKEPFDRSGVRNYLERGWIRVADEVVQACNTWLAQQGWIGRKLVLIQAGNKRTMRRGSVERSSNLKFWPDNKWESLCRAILEHEPDSQILFCGSPQEREYLQRLVDAVADRRVCSVADQLPIPRLLALQKVAHSMVSVDTGPAHSAAALGCPLVVLFGEMDPQRWRPYSVTAPVRVVRDEGSRQIRDIGLESVFEAWVGLSDRGGIETRRVPE